MRVHVVPHLSVWRQEYVVEAKSIESALAGLAVRLHHIGSTAVPGICARPIIDLLLEVEDVAILDDRSSALEDLGYEVMGEFGISGRRYFRKNDAVGVRTHQAHAFRTGSPQLERHLAFRDYLIAHPAAAQAYSALKQRLAEAHPDDIEAYMDGKDPFIKEHEAQALEWRRTVRRQQ